MMADKSSRSKGVLSRFLLEKTNFIVTGLTACCVLYTRSAGVAYFAAGAVACSLSVKVVKRIVRQPRPLHLTPGRQSYGTHSATITHYAVYVLLACTCLPVHPSLPQGQISRVLPPIIVIPWAMGIVHSRIWLGRHTWLQCIAGSVYGAAFAVGWFSLWTNGVDKVGQIVEGQFNRLLTGL
ncbi:hypothetical protein DFH11DRAFT_15513 [Phellopilus nigrolimitatus]|nr:hypothetical protein DFH11DRAFT_15513 [Phellopilus nigrolimitatus]